MAYRGISRLTADEQRQLGLRIQAGDDEAWRELVSRSVPMVFAYVRRLRWAAGIDPEDMAQQGILGLMRAARRYDPEKHPGQGFSGYAIHAIRNAVTDASRRRELLPFPDRDDIEDPRPGPLVSAERAENVAYLRLAMGRLNDHERRVIEGRHLRDGTSETLETIGIELGISKERVRQIEQDAMAKLRVRLAAKVIGVETPEGTRSCRKIGRNAGDVRTASRRPNFGSPGATG